MPIELVNALIALAGVVIAVGVSYITNRGHAKIEIEKIRIEIQKIRAEVENFYGGKLHERRLEVYPAMYSYISKFIKQMRYEKITRAAVKELSDNWQEWDSKNAILFSAFTHGVCSPIRHKIKTLSNKSDEELQKEFEPEQVKDLLKKELQAVELVLRYELGVFALEAPEVEKLKRYFSYEEAHNSAGKNAIKDFLAKAISQK